MWVKYKGKKYTIGDVNLLDYEQQYLSMRVTYAEGVSG